MKLSIAAAMLKYEVAWIILVLGFLALSSFSLPVNILPVTCVRTTWQDIIVFFTVNYIAHAATVPGEPETSWSFKLLLKGQLSYSLQWKACALFLPFAGLGRSLVWVTNHLGERDEIHQALAVGAAMVVARSESWKPHTQEQRIYVKLPQGLEFEKLDETFVS